MRPKSTFNFIQGTGKFGGWIIAEFMLALQGNGQIFGSVLQEVFLIILFASLSNRSTV